MPQIQGIIDSGMVVIGHIGLTPQSSAQLGGFKAQGNTAEAAMLLVEDAKAVEEAGAYMFLVEAMPPETGKIITQTLNIPVLGIGAGPYCDGQLMIVSDMLGIFEIFTPKFVKKYANITQVIRQALGEYVREVRERKFPSDEHCYKLKEGEREKLKKMLK